MKKSYVIAPTVVAFFLLSLTVVPAYSAPTPTAWARDRSTGVILEVVGSPYPVNGPYAEFIMVYIDNPSSNYSVGQTTFVNIFGTSQTNYVPLDNVLITSVTTSQYNRTLAATSETCYPPTGAMSSGDFPTAGYCSPDITTWQYRFAFHGWGQAAVVPGEKLLVYFQGWAISPHSRYFSDVTVTFTYEGASHTITATLRY